MDIELVYIIGALLNDLMFRRAVSMLLNDVAILFVVAVGADC